MAGSGINKSAIRKYQRDLQKQFDRVGPIEISLAASSPTFPRVGPGGLVVKLDVAAIRFLEYLFDNDGEREFRDFGEILSRNRLNDERARSLVRRLSEAGYVEELKAFGGGLSGTLTSSGASLVEDIRVERTIRSKRNADLQRQMLTWLFDREDLGEPPQSWDAFVMLGLAHLAGDPYTQLEVARQAAYLYERNLISAVTVEEDGAPGYLWPTLTAFGNDCATHYEGNVSDYLRNSPGTGGGVSNNFGPTFNAPVSGSQMAWGNQTSNQAQNIAQSQTVAEGYEAIAEAVAAVLERIHELPLDPRERQDAEDAANEILAEIVEGEPEPGRFRRAAQLLKGALAPLLLQATTGAGEGFHELARQAVESLGNAPI